MKLRVIAFAILALVLPVSAQDDQPHHIGKGVTAPSVIKKVEPKYTKQARKAKIDGAVTLSIVVGTDGKARDFKVLKSLDKGLDANAITAVSQWVFKPGMKDGTPVSVFATVQVSFHLL